MSHTNLQYRPKILIKKSHKAKNVILEITNQIITSLHATITGQITFLKLYIVICVKLRQHDLTKEISLSKLTHLKIKHINSLYVR